MHEHVQYCNQNLQDTHLFNICLTKYGSFFSSNEKITTLNDGVQDDVMFCYLGYIIISSELYIAALLGMDVFAISEWVLFLSPLKSKVNALVEWVRSNRVWWWEYLSGCNSDRVEHWRDIRVGEIFRKRSRLVVTELYKNEIRRISFSKWG